MSIVTLREILQDAHKNKYAVGMFDVHNLEMLRAAITAAEQEKAPVILALAEIHATEGNLQDLADIMIQAARRAKVPAAVHYDHGRKFDNLLKVMKLGFSSVMYDGSEQKLEENIMCTSEIVRIAGPLGVSVEAELGHVGGSEAEAEEQDDSFVIYTEPIEALEFVGRTGVDALAVSIGTVHGVYRKEPQLDFVRLREIRELVDVPLVMHGGSGLTNEDFTRSIEAGISKINLYTEIINAAARRIKEEVQEEKGAVSYPELMEKSLEEMKQVIADRIRLFGSSGRA